MATAVNPAGELSIIGNTGFGGVAETLRAVTVQVTTAAARRGPSFGSGVLWSANGLVITNAHVASGANALVEFQSGRRYSATVIARDVSKDLAALQISGAVFSAPRLRDSAMLRVGELVI